MNMKRCEDGHYYDSDRYGSCPHCNQTSVSTVYEEGGEKEYTLPTPERLENLVIDTKNTEVDDVVPTIGYFDKLEPIVGWLVAISGNHFGEDFKLKTGRNFVGRSVNMDVALTQDASVSRDKHAIILYEPKGNKFLAQPGDSKELFYINDEVVLTAREIAANDIFMLGDTKLMFIPCCSDKFNWDDVKPKEDK